MSIFRRNPGLSLGPALRLALGLALAAVLLSGLLPLTPPVVSRTEAQAPPAAGTATKTTTAPRTPEQMVQTFFDHLTSGNLTAAISLVDSRDLSDFKANMLLAAQSAKDQEQLSPMLEVLAQDVSVEKLQTYTPEQFFSHFVKSVAAFSGFDEEYLATVPPGLKTTCSTLTLGHVTEGEFLHVVHRITIKKGDFDIPKLSVASLRKAGDTLRVCLTEENVTSILFLWQEVGAAKAGATPGPGK
ncbi:MAG: hypothetical protein V2A71_10010 [Candidatus Eisenbacteria bacterium]